VRPPAPTHTHTHTHTERTNGHEQYAELPGVCAAKVAAVVRHARQRTASRAPSLGEVVALLTVVDDVAWADAAPVLAAEVRAGAHPCALLRPFPP
jgi:hypothetical protein